MTFALAIAAVRKHWRKILVGLGIVTLLVSILYIQNCRTNQQIENTQEEINQGREAISNSQVDQWAANQNAKDREAEVRRAEERSKKAKEAAKIEPKDNVEFEEANKNRCEAYPQSRECQ